jgi:hypothetical protein
MNGTSGVNPNSEPDGIDPALSRLFDRAPAPPDGDSFVRATLLKLQAARRAQLLRRCAIVLVILLLGALVSPYVARMTLLIASWFSEGLPAASLALASPLAWACGALIAWRYLTGLRH